MKYCAHRIYGSSSSWCLLANPLMNFSHSVCVFLKSSSLLLFWVTLLLLFVFYNHYAHYNRHPPTMRYSPGCTQWVWASYAWSPSGISTLAHASSLMLLGRPFLFGCLVLLFRRQTIGVKCCDGNVLPDPLIGTSQVPHSLPHLLPGMNGPMLEWRQVSQLSCGSPQRSCPGSWTWPPPLCPYTKSRSIPK